MRHALWVIFAVVLCCTALGACRSEAEKPAGATGSVSKADELEPLELRDDTPHLLLTWVDDKGDFHVVQKIADVPESGKKLVRVVVTDKEAGTGKLVYVADLSQKQSDGTYRVSFTAGRSPRAAKS